MHMQSPKPIREQISYKQNETYIQQTRDQLCKHYRLNKSDLIKFLIKKEANNLKRPNDQWCFQ